MSTWLTNGLAIWQDEDGYWLRRGRENVAGPFPTFHDADDVRENGVPVPLDEEIYHTSDRPTTVREQYVAAWELKQSLR